MDITNKQLQIKNTGPSSVTLAISILQHTSSCLPSHVKNSPALMISQTEVTRTTLLAIPLLK